MGRYLLRLDCPEHGERFVMWSTVVDAPVSYAMSEDEVREWTKWEYGQEGLRALPDRLARCRAKGTSALDLDSAEDVIVANRAGPDETEITMEEIVRRFCCEAPPPESEYEAGRETDLAVLERVLGWRRLEWRDAGFEMIDGHRFYSGPGWYGEGPDGKCHVPARRSPSRDIAAAWEVVEKLDGGGQLGTWWWAFASPGPAHDGLWEAHITEGSVIVAEAEACTLPLAICRAALKAIASLPEQPSPTEPKP